MSVLLSFFYYFYFSNVGVYVIFMPKVLSTINYTASEIGIIFSAAPLVRFLLPFLFMRGIRLNQNIFYFALILILLASSSFYFTINSFYMLLLSNIFLGIGLSLVLPYIEVISLDIIGKERYGKIRLFGSLGFILIALVLVKFLSSPQIAINFLVTVCFIMVAISFIITKKATTKEQSNQQEDINDIDILKDWRLWLSFVMMQMSFGSFYNFFTIYETDHGISLDMTIYLWSFGVIIEMFMLFFQGRLMQKNLLFILEITTMSAVLRWFLVFAFPQNLPILFFAQSLHAVSFALYHTASVGYLFGLYKHKSLAQQLYYGVGYGFGGLSGAMIAGYIYEYYPKYLFLSSSLIALIALYLLKEWHSRSTLRGES